MMRLKKFLSLTVSLLLLLSVGGCSRPAAKRVSSAASSSSKIIDSSFVAGVSQIGQSGSSSSASSAPRPSSGTAASGGKIPVLMYHSILYQPGNAVRLPPEDFQQQMKWLSDNGYTTLTLDQVYQGLSSGAGFPAKTVAVTFDDGYFDNYTNAFPVLKQYNIKATIFMISGDIGQPGYLTAQQITEMSAYGVRFECHTVTHPSLSTLGYDAQYKELSDSKAAIEALTGIRVDYVAYPNGDYNNDTITAAKAIGYKMAFKMSGGPAGTGGSLYTLPREYIGESMSDFIKKVTQAG